MVSYHASDIAAYLVNKSLQSKKYLSPLQLQKLIVIAHGYCLALLNEPLVEEAVEAWRYGPVIPELYNALKKFGRYKIEEPLSTSICCNNTEVTIQILDQVYETYGELDAGSLIDLTHKKGTPWHEVYKPNENNVIAPESIKRHYQELLKNA